MRGEGPSAGPRGCRAARQRRIWCGKNRASDSVPVDGPFRPLFQMSPAREDGNQARESKATGRHREDQSGQSTAPTATEGTAAPRGVSSDWRKPRPTCHSDRFSTVDRWGPVRGGHSHRAAPRGRAKRAPGPHGAQKQLETSLPPGADALQRLGPLSKADRILATESTAPRGL